MASFQLAALWFRSRILRDRAARWNHQYATGRWDKLRIPAEHARFAATARLLTHHVRAGQILEIGCGEGLLEQRLTPADYQGWIGVDISAVAIARAQAGSRARVRYHVADMETFEPDRKFDAIVFTESIYYAVDCRRLLRRQTAFLRPAGVFVVSIFRTRRSDRIWAEVHAETVTVERVTTANELGTWDCELLAPNEVTPAGCGAR